MTYRSEQRRAIHGCDARSALDAVSGAGEVTSDKRTADCA
jgi:hypothetical protein